jgi:hypothetical protein
MQFVLSKRSLHILIYNASDVQVVDAKQALPILY